MVPAVGNPQVARRIESDGTRLVQRGTRWDGRRAVVETWLPIYRVRFDPGWVRKRRQKSNHTVVVEIRYIQIARERIYRQAERRVETLDANTQRVRILRPRLPQNHARGCADLIRRDVGPSHHTRIVCVRNVDVCLASSP